MTGSSALAELILPYRTDWREMHRVLDYCKGKGADRAVLDARFGGGESLRETLNALEQLGLIARSEAGDVHLTEAGDRLAYAPGEFERRQVLLEAMLRYQPYRIPLERAVDAGLTVLDAPAVERIWQVDMRLGQPRNRVEEARTFFFRLADDAGLGTYRRGVRGQTTRLELAGGALPAIAETLASLGETERAASSPPDDAEPGPAARQAPALAPSAARSVQVQPRTRAALPGTSLNIQVDMSDWNLDKIEAFLSMIGYLDES